MQRPVRRHGASRLLVVLLIATTSLLGETRVGAAAARQPAAAVAPVGRIVRDLAPVHAGPGSEHALVWRLFEGSQVSVLDEAPAVDGAPWRMVRLWNSIDGWIEAATISFEPYPPPGRGGTPSTPRRRPPPRPHAPQPLLYPTPATVVARTGLGTTPEGAAGAALAAGTPVLVEAWVGGQDGRVRYRVRAEGVAGWAAPGAVALSAADPSTREVGGRPIWEPLRGTGLWFVLDDRQHGAAAGARVAEAARANGLSHVYVEVATTRGGFFGGPWLNELLPAARAAGVRVIGSVYTDLDDVPADLALTLEVARYRTPEGLALDGLTADIEETLVGSNVAAYGELLRHHVGDDYLLVATVYPPESWYGPRYPWAALVASWNVIAPMAYWRHMEERPFRPDEVYTYTQRNLAKVRALTGRPDVPVEMLGQFHEQGRPNLFGPDAPTAGEIRAAADAARDGGAVGISFFDWTRATPGHWEALAAFRW